MLVIGLERGHLHGHGYSYGYGNGCLIVGLAGPYRGAGRGMAADQEGVPCEVAPLGRVVPGVGVGLGL